MSDSTTLSREEEFHDQWADLVDPKSVLVEEFPERAFPVDYMLKDMDYVQAMASDADFEAIALNHGHELLSRASQLGHHTPYWPIISKLIDGSLTRRDK